LHAPSARESTRDALGRDVVTADARLAVAALAAGALAALLAPAAPAGLGLVLVAVALAVAAALAGPTPHPLRCALLGAIAVGLAASAALRDAGWVVYCELAAAVVLGSIAMSAPRTWRANALASIAAPLRMASGARRVASAVRQSLPAGSSRGSFALGRGLLLAGVLVAIFGALFAAGDPAFAQVAQTLLPDELPLGDAPGRLVVFGLVTALAGGLAQAVSVVDAPARKPLLRLGRSEWTLALGALNLLFALFVAVQVAVLFGGDDYVRESAGLTYAQYARSGFAQLVVIAVLTLAVVAAALRWSDTGSGSTDPRGESQPPITARRRSAAFEGVDPAGAPPIDPGPRRQQGFIRDHRRIHTKDARARRALRALLATLCLLTLVVLASALHRLGLYEEAFGFTRTRLAVHAFLLLDGALFVLVIVALAVGRREWLARATVALCALAALAFWISDPDSRIATHNVERYERTGRIDVDYLARLSADAVPALVRLPAALRADALRRQRERLARVDDGFAGANLARARARNALQELDAR